MMENRSHTQKKLRRILYDNQSVNVTSEFPRKLVKYVCSSGVKWKPYDQQSIYVYKFPHSPLYLTEVIYL